MILFLLLISLPFSSAVVTDWTCTPSPASLTPPAFPTGVTFQQLVCNSSAIPIFGKAGPLNVSVLSVDLSLPSLRLVPISNSSLAGIDQMAASHPSLLGGVNGGYFWRIDVKTFTDGVCLGKSRANALSPPSSATPNTGVGDGSIVASGALLSSNCDCIGFSRPAILTLNGTASRIDVLHRGDQPPAGLALDSLSAGPNLVSSNASGSYIDIPKDDDNIGNILEHSANTAIGLHANGTAILVTTDGYDSCNPFDASCGTNAFTLAYLMKDYFAVHSAMGCDQGGSTTMWVKGAGVVSNPGQGVRSVFSGLFVEAL